VSNAALTLGNSFICLSSSSQKYSFAVHLLGLFDCAFGPEIKNKDSNMVTVKAFTYLKMLNKVIV
jgi:hypothetical protein